MIACFRYRAVDRVVFWGKESYQLPGTFVDLIYEGMKKLFSTPTEKCHKKVSQGMGEARLAAQCYLRNVILTRAKEPNGHPVFNLIAMDELLREVGRNCINLPLPETEDRKRLNEFVGIFSKELTKRWKVNFQISGQFKDSSKPFFST